MANNTSHVVWFEELRRADVPRVGGKNASLGEMVANLATSGVQVPPGYATTAEAY
jgi:pyruvate,water dikinase